MLPGTESAKRSQGTRLDVAFLAVLSTLIALPFLSNLGWYSDDWRFLSAIRFGGHGLVGIFQSLETQDTSMRPVQFVYLAILFSVFGPNAIIAHGCNFILVSALPVLLYFVLRRLSVAREISLVAAIVFAVAPNASTDRYWLASPANLSLAFGLAAVLFGEFHPRTLGASRLTKVASVACVLCCCASYEIFVPFIGAYAMRLVAMRRFRFAAAVVAALVYFVGAKLGSSRVHDPATTRFIVRPDKFLEFGKVHLGELVVMLPQDALAGGRFMQSAALTILALTIGLITAGYVVSSTRSLPARKEALAIWLIGFACFWLGVLVFASGAYFGTTATGSDNRIALASTIGIALLVAASASFIAKWPHAAVSRLAFGATVGVYATCAASVVFAVGTSWSDAAAAQERAVAEVRYVVASPPKILLISGLCPYIGAGITFEAPYDTTGRFRILFRDPNLVADVVGPLTTVDRRGIQMDFYGKRATYAFGHETRGVDLATGESRALVDRTSAQRFVSRGRDEFTVRCPAEAPNLGVPLLPYDRMQTGANEIDRRNGHDPGNFFLRRG